MNKETEKKIDELLSVMSVREKAGQLNQVMFIAKDMEELKEMVRNGEIGSFIMAPGAFAGHDKYEMSEIDVLNEMQRIAVEESPHGIPVINGKDVIHGHKTGFPIPLACASSFNMDLIEQSFADAAREASAEGIHWSFAPMMDIARDPRWGRVIEGAGEDPYLDGKCAAAAVRGFEGENTADPERIAACAKHYIGYGATEGGRDYHKTEITDYTLRNVYLPAFKEAVKAGVSTVMSSFNEIGGQPLSSSKYLLTDVLRGELGFEGFVISDWAAIAQLMDQRVAADKKECAELSLNAGLDMDMVDNCYIENIETLVNEGKISMETLDESVRRVLRIKFKTGLFDNPYTEKREVDFEKSMKTAHDLAAESMILLKNDGTLPLDKNAKICLAGPMADDKETVLGSWSFADVERTITIKEAMEKVNGNISFSTSSIPYEMQMKFRDADVIVLAIGESSMVTGEARSLTNIELPKEEQDLVKMAHNFGKKVVGVLCCGRPLALQSIEPYFDALLCAWHGGSSIGTAVTDVLFGDICPSGRCAITFPRVTGQVPIYYNVSNSGRNVNGYYGIEEAKNYEDCLGSPLYPFGYGLSYTNFEYSMPKTDTMSISYADLKAGKKFVVSAEVKNTGDCDGKEVVQCYIRDVISKMTRPIRELKGFNKPLINKGETKTIEFELGFDELGYYGPDGKFDVERGEFDIFIGKNCLCKDKVTVCVTK